MSEEQHLEEDLSKESPNKDNTNDEEKKEPTHNEKPTKPEEEKQQVKSKVDILLKATGDTPIMKTKKWAVESDRTVGSIIEFIKKYLKLEVSDSLFLYVNQSFAPSPDQIISNLFECFGSDGKLVLHYCKTPAWG